MYLGVCAQCLIFGSLAFNAVFRHFVTKMSENKLLQTSLHVRGRANQLFSVKFIEFSVRGGPSKILHPLQRGCHTRLTIRNKSKTNLMVRRAGLSIFLHQMLACWGPPYNAYNADKLGSCATCFKLFFKLYFFQKSQIQSEEMLSPQAYILKP